MPSTVLAWTEASASTSAPDEPPVEQAGLPSDDESLRELMVSATEVSETIGRLVSSDEGDHRRNWSVALRLLTAHLHGLRFDEVATVVGMKPDNLRQILHGEARLQPNAHDRIDVLLRITTELRKVLEIDAVGDWFRTPIPALKGETPLSAAKKRRLNEIAAVVESYFDPSYS